MSAGDITIPLAQEELSLEKRRVETGRVRVETATELLNETIRTQLESSEVEIRRVEVGREVDHVPTVRVEGDVTIVPVLEEILVIEKRLVLKEELHISKRIVTEQAEVTVPVRKQQVIIHRESRDDTTDEKGTSDD